MDGFKPHILNWLQMDGFRPVLKTTYFELVVSGLFLTSRRSRSCPGAGVTCANFCKLKGGDLICDQPRAAAL
jgi:hypothetical protein